MIYLTEIKRLYLPLKTVLIILALLYLFMNPSVSVASEINAVLSENNILKIQLTDKVDFKEITSEDPFRLKLLLKDTKPGVLQKKMIFHEGAISEISTTPDKEGLLLDVLFAEPSKADVSLEGNVLIIKVQQKENKISATKTINIIELTMTKTEEGFELSIVGDDELPEPQVETANGHTIVKLENVKLNTEPDKDIPIALKKEGNELYLDFFFGKDFTVEPIYLGDEILLNVNKIKPSTLTAKAETLTAEATATEEYQPTKEIKAQEKTISLDLQDADIVGVFRLLGDVSGYNMVIHPDVKGKITLKLVNVPWSKALDIICKTFYLEKVIEGNIIRVAPLKVFQEEKKLQTETKELFEKAEQEETRVYVLKYSSVDKVKATIEASKVLSPKGNISTDDRTRTLIIKDIPSSLAKVERLIAELDKPIKQILLESRIVEISSSFAKALGFEWGIQWRPPDSRTNIVGSQAGTTTVSGGSTPLAINLPASTGSVGTGTTAFTIGYINASGTFALDLRISALQETGKGKVISNPKIITLDNQKAKILQGESIPYGEKDVQSGQISTKFKDVAITVEATPHLIDDKSMLLDVHVVKEDLVEFVNIGGVYAPRTIKIEGDTKVSIKDGETLVIGGIYKRKDSIRDSKVPGLGDIPLVGELFKSTGRDDSLYEVMIFITPRVLKYE